MRGEENKIKKHPYFDDNRAPSYQPFPMCSFFLYDSLTLVALLATGPGAPSLSCRSLRCVAPNICSRERRSEVRRHDIAHSARCRIGENKGLYVTIAQHHKENLDLKLIVTMVTILTVFEGS